MGRLKYLCILEAFLVRTVSSRSPYSSCRSFCDKWQGFSTQSTQIPKIRFHESGESVQFAKFMKTISIPSISMPEISKDQNGQIHENDFYTYHFYPGRTCMVNVLNIMLTRKISCNVRFAKNVVSCRKQILGIQLKFFFKIWEFGYLQCTVLGGMFN